MSGDAGAGGGNAPEPVIRLRGVRREYRMGEAVVRALDGVDLDVARGELLVLMGPSGCGKSTLLNVLGCIDRPDAGTYRLDGVEVTGLSEAGRVRIRREKVGFIFQTFHLVPRMTAERNVELPMMFAGVDAGERRKRAQDGLAAVGLAQRAAHRPDQLSGGERQRVAIARALVMHPPILLADEPTGNLDSRTGDEIVGMLRDLNAAGQTIIMVTHSSDVAKIGHRVLHMKDGRF
ncbi:MAG: ABC transporter ATP-binding protein, partial [Planctomycetia bacterium]|nr:ABC transporter ATP-binding protein [Planctomycetia bacterium]